MAPTKINMKIYQGSTFTEVLRYESPVKIYVPITSIFNTAPLTVTAPAHGMVEGWRAKISNVLGMTEVNDLGYIIATSVTTDTVVFNSINPVGFKAYTSGGILEYNQPNNLSGLTARMQIREKLTSSTTVDELTTENGRIVIDNTAKTITLLIPATTTADYTFKSAVYSLELVSGSTIIPFVYGNLVLDKEITR